MAEYNLGRVAFVDKGAYSQEDTYNKWDFVTTVDSTYLFIGETPQIGKPVTDTNFWKCIADGKPSTLAAAAANLAKAATIQATTDAIQTNTDIQTAEGIRVGKENIRISNETNRVSQESSRVTVENSRVLNETTRTNQETGRVNSETGRANAETSRTTAEGARVISETTRGTNETTRQSNETIRTNQETDRVNAEAARVLAGSEVKSNKTSDIETNKTSVDKYPTTKGVNDWSLLKFPLKGVAADYISLYSRKIATVVNGVITAIQETIDAHNSRVTFDSGAIRTQSLVKIYYDFCYDNQMFDSIKFAWLGEGGGKFRTSGIYTFYTKIYSMLGGNDASQVTSTNQPYLSGNIAPNEKYGLKNPNGGSSYMTHPTISFAANESWSVTTVLNSNVAKSQGYADTYCGGVFTRIRCYSGNSDFIFIAETGVESKITNIPYIYGKATVITLVADGTGQLLVYFNGALKSTFTALANRTIATFVNLCKGSVEQSASTIKSHIIRSQALTPTQVTAEYNLLRSYIPEIENVTIGTQTWATSNCEMVATPQGNLIQEMQANANIEVVNGGFSGATDWVDTNADGLADGLTITNGLIPVINDYSGDKAQKITKTIGSTVSADMKFSQTPTIGKFYKITIRYRASLSAAIDLEFGHVIKLTDNANWTTINSYGLALKQDKRIAMYWASANDWVEVDYISIQEIGWSGSQELYDAIYAQTEGSAEQKTYAAVKAAAMWRSPNNDIARAAVYGKHYNKFALKLLKMDIAYFNTANPTALWGWHVATRAENTTLATVGGNALKATGVNYWNTANGTNTSGATILGGGYTAYNGTYTDEKVSTLLMCEDDDFAHKVVDGSNSVDEVAITTEGGIIRLIKN